MDNNSIIIIIIIVIIIFFSGKREGGGSCSPIEEWPAEVGGPLRPLNEFASNGASGGVNMTPDDPAPDEEFALAISQKSQVS